MIAPYLDCRCVLGSSQWTIVTFTIYRLMVFRAHSNAEQKTNGIMETRKSFALNAEKKYKKGIILAIKSTCKLKNFHRQKIRTDLIYFLVFGKICFFIGWTSPFTVKNVWSFPCRKILCFFFLLRFKHKTGYRYGVHTMAYYGQWQRNS